MLGKGDQVLLDTLIWIMAAKMEEPTSHVKVCVNNWIKIVFERSYSKLFHRAWVPSPLQTWDPDWVSGSGLGLAQ